jgi:hypothetical protein
VSFSLVHRTFRSSRDVASPGDMKPSPML